MFLASQMEDIIPPYPFAKISVGLVTGLLFTAISINMRSVECIIKKTETGTSISEKIISVQVRDSKDIYPDTKWCGVGNVAANDSDFGRSEETDKCCEGHDDCKTFILAGDTKYGLLNTENYTVSDCDCDQTLFDCITGILASDSAAAHDIKSAREFGALVFNGSRRCLQWGIKRVCVERDWRGNWLKYTELNKRGWNLLYGK